MDQPFKKLKPFMTYLDENDHLKLKKFSRQKKMTMAKVIREGVLMRMATDSQYVSGFNDGINKAADVVKSNTASQIRFPSGQSFAELICDELFKQIMHEASNETVKGK
jgi:hypothetical protein